VAVREAAPGAGRRPAVSDPGYETALRERRNAAVAEVERRGLDALHGLASDAVDVRIVRLTVIYLDDLGGQAADFLIGLLGQFTSKYKSGQIPRSGLSASTISGRYSST
jgi:hypothetical protein